MEVFSTKSGNRLVIAIVGRLDSSTVSQLEKEIVNVVDISTRDLVLDFSQVDYISNAGLSVLLNSYRKMTASGGAFRIIGARDAVLDSLEMTGMDSLFLVEKD